MTVIDPEDPSRGDERTARQVSERYSDSPVARIRQFQMGRINHVFDVTTESGSRFVVRFAAAGSERRLEGFIFWHAHLTSLGLRCPAILHADTTRRSATPPFLILERLPGTDLVNCYRQLGDAAKRALAATFLAIQRTIATLPPGRGYGGVLSYDDPLCWPTWEQAIGYALSETRRRTGSAVMRSRGDELADALARDASRFSRYFASIPPLAFHEDLTHQNMLVHDGEVVGILDFDEMCFGDVLLTVGRTAVGLRAHGCDTAYVDHVCALAGLTPAQFDVVHFYMAVATVAEIARRVDPATQRSDAPAGAQDVEELAADVDLLRSRY